MRIAGEVIAASPLRHYYFTVRARPVTNFFFNQTLLSNNFL